jgi:Fur family transcriptional regulator, zinc uptake regulator
MDESVAFATSTRYNADMTLSRTPQTRPKPLRVAAKGALAAAEDRCRREGAKLTPARRQILEILAQEGRPLGAYEMIERVAAATGKHPAPISIYRALDFLLDNGLVHRLASRNAYLACVHGHEHQDQVVFLICDKCGSVTEAAPKAVGRDLAALATEEGFKPRAQVMEIAGLCRDCRA